MPKPLPRLIKPSKVKVGQTIKVEHLDPLDRAVRSWIGTVEGIRPSPSDSGRVVVDLTGHKATYLKHPGYRIRVTLLANSAEAPEPAKVLTESKDVRPGQTVRITHVPTDPTKQQRVHRGVIMDVAFDGERHWATLAPPTPGFGLTLCLDHDPIFDVEIEVLKDPAMPPVVPTEGNVANPRALAHTTEGERRSLAFALLEQMGGTPDEVEAMHVDAYQAVLDEVAYRIGQVHSTHRLFHEDWNEVARWLRDGAPLTEFKPERYRR